MARVSRRLGLVLVLAAGSAVLVPGHADALPVGAPPIGMVCTPGTVVGSTHTFNLTANTGYVATPDGNSIFIFEVAGLCIGHLGHLHVRLDDTHFAAIGRLDILMVPIDGAYTMSLDGISEITRRLHASVVLPMHRFATPLQEFMERIGKEFEIDQRSERTLRISRDTLPRTPTVIILDGV